MRTQGRTDHLYRDRWVVFHFHLEEGREVFFDIDGHTYAGFVTYIATKLHLPLVLTSRLKSSMTVFHAHAANDRTTDSEITRVGDWRAGWRQKAPGGGGINVRAVIRCPWDQTE